jgi:hypothetical protein
VPISSRLRSILLCAVLEFGALAGVPMPPERIRELLDVMHRPKLAHVLPAEDAPGDPPDVSGA